MMQAGDVKMLRERFGLSQEKFSSRFGFSLGTLRHWEQGSRRPDKAASVLLALVLKFPDIVSEVVRDGTDKKWKSGGTFQDTTAMR
jgi:putative transcriptional regulator